MKKFYSFLFLIIVLASKFSYAQNYSNRELAVISFNYDIHQQVKLKFDEFAYLFPKVKHKKADNMIALLKERTWYLLKYRLEEETGMYILPLNSHGKSFKCDYYGFPDVSINRAIRLGASRFYLRVDLTIDTPDATQDKGYGFLNSKSKEVVAETVGFTPRVTIDVITYRESGIIPMNRLSGIAIAEKPWEVSDDTFVGILNRNEYEMDDTSILLGLINVAITDLVSQFKR